jgi:hypothetical protein
MRKAIIIVSAIALTAVMAPPASATQSSIGFGVARTLTPGDIAKRLGAFSPGYSVEVFPNYTSDWQLCSTRNPNKPMVFGGMNTEIRAFFNRPSGTSTPVLQSILTFPSAQKAQEAFATVQTRVKRCTDTIVDKSEPGDEFVFERSSAYSHGTMNAVANTSTVYVFEDFTFTVGGPGAEVSSEDSFTTYSLVNDAILAVSFRRPAANTITNKERKGVENTTAAAIRNYQRRTPPKPRSLQSTYTFGVDHFITPKDVPVRLIRAKNAQIGSINLEDKRGRLFLCDPQNIQFSDDANTAPFIGITAARTEMKTSVTNNSGREVQQVAYDFGTNKKARKAFAAMQKEVTKCTGTTTSRESGEGDGDGQPFSVTFERTYTNASAPEVSVKNVPSIALGSRLVVKDDNSSESSTSSSYTLLTLTGSTVLSLTYERANNISAKQRTATQELAKTAIATWQKNYAVG